MPAISSPRPGTPTDAIDATVPRRVAEPESPAALAAILATASRERLQTVLCGGGSKIGWGRPPDAVDLLVRTTGLTQLVAHRDGDMVATVQAGMRLADLNRQLASRGQWLPVTSAFDAATIGGVVAANESGPVRHRHGTPRDLLLGVTLALADGRIVKAGGSVVKNVAGYDLGRLMCGSHGTLAAIADVTVRLVPTPHASATLVVEHRDPAAAAADALRLADSQLEPAALDVAASDGTWQVLVQFASSRAATRAQVEAARALAGGSPRVIAGDEERDVWTRQVRISWDDDGVVIRLSWLPARLAQVLAMVTRLEAAGGVRATLAGRVLGSGLLRIDGPPAAVVAAVTSLRADPDAGHVVVLRAPLDVKRAVDVWGPPRPADTVAHAIKRALDPVGILNAGRGPI